MTGEPEVVFETRGALGLITLNRPKALNALTLGMVREIHPQLEAWGRDSAITAVAIQGAGEKAFCAGGDIRALYDSGKAGTSLAIDFYREEYKLNTAIKRFPKPYVALINGIVMGGGVGLSVHGAYRVAGERFLFAMPETGIGLFPDVGGTYFLPRLAGKLGLCLGLTGVRLKLEDALWAGIATHYVPQERHGALLDALAGAEKPEHVHAWIAEHHVDPDKAPMAASSALIDRVFAHDTVEAIMEALAKETGDFAQGLLGGMKKASPTSLHVTNRQLREGARLSFEECMKLEFRLTNRFMRGHDFYEGVRALIVDKDQNPRWTPHSLDAVRNGDVSAYFAHLGTDELVLP